jgi:hypothetical protein
MTNNIVNIAAEVTLRGHESVDFKESDRPVFKVPERAFPSVHFKHEFVWFGTNSLFSDIALNNLDICAEHNVQYTDGRVGFDLWDLGRMCRADYFSNEPFINLYKRHKKECSFDCIVQSFYEALDDVALPAHPPILERQFAIDERKAYARQQRKKLKMKKYNLRRRERLDAIRQDRANKELRASPEFLSGYNGKNETKAEKRIAKSQAGYLPDSIASMFNAEKYKNYADHIIQSMRRSVRIVYCDKHNIPVPSSERDFEEDNECFEDEAPSMTSRLYGWLIKLLPECMKEIFIRYKNLFLEMISLIKIHDIIDKLKSFFPSGRLTRFLFYAYGIVLIACFYKIAGFGGFAITEMLFAFAIACGFDFVFEEVYEIIANFFDHSKPVSEAEFKDGLTIAKEGLIYVQSLARGAYESPFAVAIKDLVMLLTANDFFPNRKKEIKAAFGSLKNYKNLSVFEIIIMISESFINLFTIAESISQGTPLHKIFFGGDPFMEFLHESRALLAFKDRVYDGLPVMGCKQYKAYMCELEALVKVGKELCAGTGCRAENKDKVRSMLIQLETEYGMRKATEKNHNRIPPRGIVLHGPSKVGKSLLLKYFCALHSAIVGREFHEDQIYNRSKTSPYWEGHNPYAQPYIFFSELANMSLEYTMKSGDTQLSEMNSLLDGLPMLLDMAFGDKGKVYASPDLVIGDTNNPGLWAKEMCSYYAAQMRRYIFCEVTVRPEFRALTHEDVPRETSSLDSNKSMAAGGNYLDRYTFCLYSFEDYNGTPLRVDMCQGDIYTITKFLVPILRNHIDTNDALVKRDLYSFVKEYALSVQDPLNVTGLRKYTDAELKEAEADSELFELMFIAKPEQEVVSEAGLGYIYNGLAAFGSGPPAGVNPMSNFGKFCVWGKEFRYKVVDYGNTSLNLLVALFTYLLCFSAVKLIPFFVLNYRMFYSSKLQLTLLFLLYCFWSIYLIPVFVVVEGGLFGLAKVWSVVGDLFLQKVKNFVGLGKDSAYARFVNFVSPGRARFTMSRKAFAVSAAVSFFLTSLYFYRKPLKALVEAVTEGHKSDFKLPSEANEKIVASEEMDEICTDRRFRFKVKNTFTYNVGKAPVSLALYKGEPDALLACVATNIRRVRIQHGDVFYASYIFGIKGNYAVVNTHMLPKGVSFEIQFAKDNLYTEFTVFKIMRIDPKMIIDCGNDVSVIYFEKELFTDVTPHLGDDFPLQWYDGYMQKGFVRARRSDNTEIRDVVSGELVTLSKPFAYQCDHYPGLCGYPLIVQKDKSGSQICAIHAAGLPGTRDAYGVTLHKTIICSAISELEAKSTFVPILSQGELCFEQFFPHPKSAFVHEKVDYMDYYMRHEGPIIVRGHSKLEENKWSVEATEFLKTEFQYVPRVIYGKPLMQPHGKGENFVSPYNNAIRKMDNDYKTPDYSVLNRVITELSNHILDQLASRGIETLSPLTTMEAINGVDEDPFIGRINTSTSAAYPYGGKKRDHLPVVSEDPLIREPTDQIKRDIYTAKLNYRHGINNGFIYDCQLKDEPRELSKCKAGKTRVFYMSPLVNLILAREYLAPFYSLMVEHPDVFGVAIGVDMHRAADIMYHRLQDTFEESIEEETKEDPSIMEGDYGGFDVSMPLFVGRAACTVVYLVLRSLGYSEHALKMVQGLLSDSVYPFLRMCQDVFVKAGLQPSGKYATAEDNSLRGLIMLMYAFYMHPQNVHLNFFECVLPLLYGDDLLAKINKRSGCVMNNNYYAKFCAEHYGVEYTNAQKGKEFEDFLPIDEVSFLNRRFRLHPEGKFVAALDLDSINKTLTWTLPSQEVPYSHQAHGAFMGLCRELFMHCSGREQYERCFWFLKNILLTNFGGEGLDYPLPTYSELCESILGIESPAAA